MYVVAPVALNVAVVPTQIAVGVEDATGLTTTIVEEVIEVVLFEVTHSDEEELTVALNAETVPEEIGPVRVKVADAPAFNEAKVQFGVVKAPLLATLPVNVTPEGVGILTVTFVAALQLERFVTTTVYVF